MATIEINYNDLLDTAKYARKMADDLEDYSSEIKRRTTSPINSLPGTDNKGYANSATSCASNKIRANGDKAGRFRRYATNIERFVSNAKNADTEVAKSIKNIGGSYIGKRNWWNATCDTISNFLFVDAVNSTAITRFLGNMGKMVWSHVTDFTERTYAWFKHGDGKYVFNIIVSAAAILGAIITAVAAIPTGGSTLPLVVGCITFAAASIGAIITTANCSVKIYNNAKALSLEDDPGASRYVGKIEGISDATEKYDMGDKKDNKEWESAGKVIDNVKLGCDVIGIAGSAMKLGAVTDVRTSKVVGYKFSKSNIKFNIKSSMGFDFDKNQWDLKKMFIPDLDQGTADKGVFKYMSDDAKKAINTVSVIDNSLEKLEKVDNVYSNVKQGLNFSSWKDSKKSIGVIWHTTTDVSSLLGSFPVLEPFNKYMIKPINTGIKTVDAFAN